ncbi:type I phosphoribosyltransferase [Aminobacter niigataensis]|uniref:hypothetical protein n=1 Tax=Aminobacter niigataensis TaxID=83265 RepID=UPI00298F2FE0|nr:hypothetical protein [Aminobacter niigataensis]
MTRVPWPKDFPEAFVNAQWASGDKQVPTLSSHPLYQAAKGERNIEAAIAIIDDLYTRECVLRLVDHVESCGGKPKIISPSCQPGDSNNALAIGYAQWLSHEFDWDVETEVFQEKTVSRDKSNTWTRIANRCAFRGEIDKGASYVIVDDVITTGGTLADLRSFIHRKGGMVIAMSAIASRDGRPQKIRLGDDTRADLERFYGNDLGKFCYENLGFSHECFTDSEARAVRGCSGYVDLGKKILRARNA